MPYCTQCGAALPPSVKFCAGHVRYGSLADVGPKISDVSFAMCT